MPIRSPSSRFAWPALRRQTGSAATPVLALIAVAAVALLIFVGAELFSSESASPGSAADSATTADRGRDARASDMQLPIDSEDAADRASRAMARREASRAERRAAGARSGLAEDEPSGTRRGSRIADEQDDEFAGLEDAGLERRGQATRTSATEGNLLAAVDPNRRGTDHGDDAGRTSSGRGFAVGQVFEGTPLWDAGVRPGDKIPSVNGEPVSTWEDVIEKIGLADGPVVLEIVPPGGSSHETSLYPPLCCMTKENSAAP